VNSASGEKLSELRADPISAEVDVAPRAADRPLVSVIIPSYNAMPTIERALRSARSQVGASLEIIVADDRSTDDTVGVLGRLDWPDLRVIALPVNGGVSAARNAAIQAARGEFLAFLDADDEWLPGKLASQLELFRRHPQASIVATDCDIGPTGGPVARHHRILRTAEGPAAWKQLLQGNFLHTSSVMCRRHDVLELGGFRQDLKYGEDLDFWIRLALRGEVRLVPDVKLRVYTLPSGLSATQPLGDLTFTLPMIRAHVDRLGARLDPAERRRILGRRHFGIAYPLYQAGSLREAAPLFRTAFGYRWHPGRSAVFFLDCHLGGLLRRWTR